MRAASTVAPAPGGFAGLNATRILDMGMAKRQFSAKQLAAQRAFAARARAGPIKKGSSLKGVVARAKRSVKAAVQKATRRPGRATMKGAKNWSPLTQGGIGGLGAQLGRQIMPANPQLGATVGLGIAGHYTDNEAMSTLAGIRAAELLLQGGLGNVLNVGGLLGGGGGSTAAAPATTPAAPAGSFW